MLSFHAFFAFLLTVSVQALATTLEGFNHESELAKRQVPNGPCASGVHVIAASGTGAENRNGYGLIKTLVTNITYAIPGSDDVSVPYPKGSPHRKWSSERGAANLTKYITNYNKHCPKTKIVLVGYSEGSVIIMNTLCGASQAPWKPTAPINPKFANTVIAAIVYGDETFTPGASYTSPYANSPYPGRFPRTNLSACGPFASGIQSFCHEGDPQCSSAGISPSDHYTYFDLYDVAATNFVLGRWRSLHD